MALNHRERRLIQEALDAAELTTCGWSDELKQKTRTYLDTWVAVPLRTVLKPYRPIKDEENP